LADITGIEEIIMSFDDNSTIKDVLKELNLKFGKDFENTVMNTPDLLSKYVLIGKNGKDIRSFEGLVTTVQEGDEVFLLPAIAGG
jgi:molybdopterin converting factor small subunit